MPFLSGYTVTGQHSAAPSASSRTYAVLHGDRMGSDGCAWLHTTTSAVYPFRPIPSHSVMHL